jgi:hypothetical protein
MRYRLITSLLLMVVLVVLYLVGVRDEPPSPPIENGTPATSRPAPPTGDDDPRRRLKIY